MRLWRADSPPDRRTRQVHRQFLDLDNDAPPSDQPAHPGVSCGALSELQTKGVARPPGRASAWPHRKILTAPHCARLTTDVAGFK